MSTEGTHDESVQPEQPEAPATLAEFREQFPAAPVEGQPAPEPAAEKLPRRRAKSHQADAEDVPEIAALTKQLREAEDAIKIERKDGESDRVFQLRKRAEIAKRAAQPPVVERPAPAAQPAAAIAAPPSAFTEKEPTIDQFASEADPYTAWQRALGRYDRKKEAFDASQETAKASYQAQERRFNEEINQGIQAHAARAVALAQSRPDVKALFDAEAAKPPQDQIQLTLAVRGAIEFHERGPEMVVALLQNPELADELFLLTTGRAVGDPRTDSLVATVRRRLLQRISGAGSGSPAPPRPFKPAPRPPNPERTVPQTPRESSPTDAPGSLAEHRRQFPTRH
jgi:hypothetical protein